MPVATMRETLTQREYVGWQKFWNVEPWGAWRDNVHAAIIAREVRRSFAKAAVGLDEFMVMAPQERRRNQNRKVFAALRAMAGPRTKAGPPKLAEG